MRTIRHLKPSQILWRMRYAIEKRLPVARTSPSVAAPAAFDMDAMARLRSYVGQLAWLQPPSQADIDALCRNEFTFLHHTVQFDASVEWGVSEVSALWRYHLHYFGWGRTLALAYLKDDREEYRAQFLRLAGDWIERNPRGTSPGWDAFVVSSRLMNWVQAFSVFGEVPSRVLESFVLQTDWLLHHLEWDVRANHLLKNAQALAVAGPALGKREGAAATRCGLEVLAHELDEQILEDGGHYERSFMYHCQVLEDNLLVHAALENPPEKLGRAIEKMTGFLARMIYPDDGIPQFGDASLELDTPPAVPLRFAKERFPAIDTTRPTGSRAEKSSGFYILERTDGEARMTVKAGEPGPAYQLGHAHCDMLSYEFTMGTDRLIVDSGVYGYEDDARRAYCRSTSAHNTVQVNGREQMECWDRFRVGRRYTPAVHAWREYEGGHLLHASHDGFAPYRHERLIYLSPGAHWLVADRVNGPGSCDIESFVHVHPDASLSEADGVWRIEIGGNAIVIIPFEIDRTEFAHGSERTMRGWHFPSFGVARPATCLTFHRRAECPVVSGYAIFTDSGSRETSESLRNLAQELLDMGA